MGDPQLTFKSKFCFKLSKEISAGKVYPNEYLTTDALIFTQKNSSGRIIIDIISSSSGGDHSGHDDSIKGHLFTHAKRHFS